MTDETTEEPGTMTDHLDHLAVTADDIVAFLTREHEEGEIHSDALPKAERLALGLKDMIKAIREHTHLEHLAVSKDDVWRMLTVKHRVEDDAIT